MSETKKNNTEELAEQLHIWYLEATRELNPDNYNPKAQIPYAELNEDQKQIDRYIARKILTQQQELQRDLDEARHLLSKHEERIHRIVRKAAEFGEKFECGNQE